MAKMKIVTYRSKKYIVLRTVLAPNGDKRNYILQSKFERTASFEVPKEACR